MRILHVINSLYTGGAEVLLLQTVRELQQYDYIQTVYLLNGADTPILEQLRSTGIPIIVSRTNNVYHPVHVLEFLRHLFQKHYDLIHVHLFPAQLWVALARSLAGVQVPLVTTEHSTYNRRRKLVFRMLDWWMYGHYDRILCISRATEDALTSWIPAVRGKTIFAPNGIDLSRFSGGTKLKPDLLGDWDGFTAMFTARFEAQKDHATLIKAVARVPNLRLILVGDGVLRPAMQQLAAQLDVLDRVVFLGKRTDIPALLKQVDLYVHSVHWEGFGLAALEAMASGLPIIASQVPGLTEVVGDAGLYFEPGSVDQLVQCLTQVLLDQDLRTRLGECAAARARLFSIQEAVKRYVTVYESVVTRRM